MIWSAHRQLLTPLLAPLSRQQKQKQVARDEMTAAAKLRDEMRAELRDIRDKTKANLETLEEKIRALESTLAHDSLSPQEEKRLHDQLNALNAAKPIARQAAALNAKLAENDALRSQIKARLESFDAAINQVKAVQDQHLAALNELRGKQETSSVDIPALIAERKECREIIDVCRDKINATRKEFDEKYREWIKLDKNYNAYVRAQKKKK